MFNGINYLQTNGYAMSAICATGYVNIFICKLEKLHICFYIRNISTLYCRFICDIFFIWNGAESELIEFLGNLNKKHPSLKFEFTCSKISLTLLSAKIYGNQNRILFTTINRKLDDCRNLLHYHAAHPKSLKVSIPFSQALHTK